jgi:RHH-type rel operon transcriptional repressor/antitoxin RelB
MNLAAGALMLYMYSRRKHNMLALRLPPDIDKRLSDLAKKTGRSKSFYAREAILEHLDDLEDLYLAKKALEEGGEPISLEELEREFGLASDR